MRFYTNVAQFGNRLLVRGYDGADAFKEAVPYEPYLFMLHKEGTYKTLQGRPAKRIDFATIKHARDFIERQKDVVNSDVYGMTNWPYLFINDEYPGEVAFDETKISVVVLDIEVMAPDAFPHPSKAADPIVSIALRYDKKNVVFGLKPYAPRPDTSYVKCEDEAAMLEAFLKHWDIIGPDVVTGWHIEGFDIPYLYNRITKVLGTAAAKRLSPWGIVKDRTMLDGGVIFELAGLFVADYLPIYKKFTFGNQESYRLDFIAQIELDRGKLDHGDNKSLQLLYMHDFQRYIDYNIEDCVLVDELEQKLGFISLIFTRAYLSKINYADCLATVRPWDALIHNYLMDQGIVVPPNKENHLDKPLIGGYVKEVTPGMSDWVAGFDLKSSYPHGIMQYNISPETIGKKVFVDGASVDYSAYPPVLNLDFARLYGEKNSRLVSDAYYSTAVNGVQFSSGKKGFLPELMRQLYNDRAKYQKQLKKAKADGDTKNIARLHNLQRALKDTLNSGYGALANVHFRWFNFDMAEAITCTGQLAIRSVERAINIFLNKTLKTEGVDYVIAVDTDSVYVNLGPMVKKVIGDTLYTPKIHQVVRQFCLTSIQKVIDERLVHNSWCFGCPENKMQMNLENISDRAIWTATKHYILNMREEDGVVLTKPKLKMKGIEAIKSSTPKVVREAIKNALTIIMLNDEKDLQRYNEEFRRTFDELPFEDIAFPRSISGMGKYRDASTVYKKGTPIQVKGSLLYNFLLQKHDLEGTYPPIHDGDKIRFAWLREPNPILSNVISCTHDLPKAFGLDAYLDRDAQFFKAYLEPIQGIVKHIGWNTEAHAPTALEEAFA